MKRAIFYLTSLFFIATLISFQSASTDLEVSMKRGKEIYLNNCISCHMDNGEGIPGVFPPLAKSDYLMADLKRSVQQILYGARGEMTVNGKTYSMEMAGFNFTDEEMSDLLNYIRNSWGNKAAPVTSADVAEARKK